MTKIRNLRLFPENIPSRMIAGNEESQANGVTGVGRSLRKPAYFFVTDRRGIIAIPLCLLIFAAFLNAGCCLNQERWRTPNILHPGSLEQQRYNMSISDPLPAPGVGMKNSGIRPRDADKPRDPFSTQSGIYEQVKPSLVQSY